MSGPFGSSQWMYSSGGFYPDEIEQSLRFNDDDSAYLSRTPASAGNRKTWTWSGWVKLCDMATGYNGGLFGAGSITSGQNAALNYRDNGFDFYLDGAGAARITTTQVFRDPSAWYHIVLTLDTTNATSSDRLRFYINGERVTAFSTNSQPALNYDGDINNPSLTHFIGLGYLQYFDGYMAEVNFIDGQALDPTSFGEFKSGVWVANEYTGSYGTNGFYLPFKQTTVANGFNAVTYTGNGGTQSIEGVGFSPDLVWGKARSEAHFHTLVDQVRGAGKLLFSNSTAAEETETALTSFDVDGFTVGPQGNALNNSGASYVAWCWDAGSGSPVSNTDGSITSSVKANPAYGFSVVGYTGNSTSGATIGHGLSSAPDMIIVKNRTDGTQNWRVQHSSLGPTQGLSLNATDAAAAAVYWDSTAPTSSVFSVDGSAKVNASGDNYIAYCFAEISGYSKISSYSGTGASGNTITTGFKPAFVMIKRTDAANNWIICDATRNTTNPVNAGLYADLSNSENTTTRYNFTDTGFEIISTLNESNASGGTYIYMAFADTRDAAFWRDLSGNDNTWQPNALQNSDVMPDSPTNNFATWNPLDRDMERDTKGLMVFSEGNLLVKTTEGADGARSNFWVGPNQGGKYYFELLVENNTNTAKSCGLASEADRFDTGAGGEVAGGGAGLAPAFYSNGSLAYNNSLTSGFGPTYTKLDIIGVAVDCDNEEVYFSKNNAWVDGSGGTTTFASAANAASSGLADIVTPFAGLIDNSGVFLNAGQDSSFAGNKTAQGNTDDNGVGDFYYAPPAGYLALCTANLPDPVIDPAQDDVPSDYFNTVLYSGNSSTQSIAVGFQPDFVWTKERNIDRNHDLFNAISGAGYYLESNTTDAETLAASSLTSFDADGFTLGNSTNVNFSGRTYVGWNWLAGNGTSSNTDGSITSTVSVNQKAGFSVVGFADGGGTIGHGLGADPATIIIKNRDGGDNADPDRWYVWHKSLSNSAQNFLWLNDTSAVRSSSLIWSNTAPTNDVFSFGYSESGSNFIAYCFAEVEGYSKFGSYTGNGSTDGPFVHCGFRPAWVMVKRTDATGSWRILDNARDGYNPKNELLLAENSTAEQSYVGREHELLSNGFKIRHSSSSSNASGGTYIFMAFAEMPAKYSLGR